MNIQTTCCVTGHRAIPPEKLSDVRIKLLAEIRLAISDGYTHFISGGATGIDILFAQLVLALREEGCPITLELDIPYRNRLKSPELRPLLPQCELVSVTSEAYQPSCFFARNRDMVQKSARVIAVYDGRERGGTFFTIRYARAMGRDLHIIEL